MDKVDQSTLAYLIQEIRGAGGTDTTVFLWENGSVYNTIPATPNQLRGSIIFRNIKHLPPYKKFTGIMNVFRQFGEIKGWEFKSKN